MKKITYLFIILSFSTQLSGTTENRTFFSLIFYNCLAIISGMAIKAIADHKAIIANYIFQCIALTGLKYYQTNINQSQQEIKQKIDMQNENIEKTNKVVTDLKIDFKKNSIDIKALIEKSEKINNELAELETKIMSLIKEESHAVIKTLEVSIENVAKQTNSLKESSLALEYKIDGISQDFRQLSENHNKKNSELLAQLQKINQTEIDIQQEITPLKKIIQTLHNRLNTISNNFEDSLKKLPTTSLFKEKINELQNEIKKNNETIKEEIKKTIKAEFALLQKTMNNIIIDNHSGTHKLTNNTLDVLPNGPFYEAGRNITTQKAYMI